MIDVGLDSNFIAYLSGVDRGPSDAAKIEQANALYVPLAASTAIHVPIQALGELYNVLVKVGRDSAAASRDVMLIAQAVRPLVTSEMIFSEALDLAVAHRLQIWDAIIVNACAAAGCTLLLSEDMQDGFSWRGMTVTNPFATAGMTRLRRAIPDLA